MTHEITRAIIEGCHLAVYSSIKPGCIHRLRLDGKTYYMVSSCLGVVDYIEKAVEIGEKVRRGELAAAGLEIGKLLGKALREAYRWTSYKPYPDIVVPSIVNASVLSYVEPEDIVRESGELRKALELFIGGTRWRDVRELANALKSINAGDMVDHMASAGITYSQALTEGLTLADAFNVLGSRWPGFLAVTPREHIVYDYVKKLMEYYRRYRDGVNSIIAVYLEMIKSKLPKWALEYVEKAFNEGLMASRSGSKLLFELDLKLRKNNIVYDQYIGLLVAVTQLCVYEGLRV